MGAVLFVVFLTVLAAVLYSRRGSRTTVIPLTPAQEEVLLGIPQEDVENPENADS